MYYAGENGACNETGPVANYAKVRVLVHTPTYTQSSLHLYRIHMSSAACFIWIHTGTVPMEKDLLMHRRMNATAQPTAAYNSLQIHTDTWHTHSAHNKRPRTLRSQIRRAKQGKSFQRTCTCSRHVFVLTCTCALDRLCRTRQQASDVLWRGVQAAQASGHASMAQVVSSLCSSCSHSFIHVFPSLNREKTHLSYARKTFIHEWTRGLPKHANAAMCE